MQGFNACAGTKVSETGLFATGAFTLPVTGLPAGTQIYFKGMAVNANGTAYTAETGFITRPDQVSVLAPTKIDNDKFYAHWNPTIGATSYKIYVSTNSGFTSYISGYGPMVGFTGTDLTIAALDYLTPYYYKIAATNAGGEGVASDLTWITTTYYASPVAWLKFEETV